MRVGRTGQITLDRRQVERQHPLVFRRLQGVGPQAGRLRIGFHQGDLIRLAPGQAQIVQRLLVDVEHRRRGPIFRAHVGDGGPVADGQAVGALAEEFQPGAHHLLPAQEFGQGQNNVGGGDAFGATAGQVHAHDVGQAHHRRPAQHDRLGLQSADSDGDDAQRIDVRRVAVGADAGVREGHAVAHLDDRAHLLQIDLVHDAVAGGNDVHILERPLGPFDEVEAVRVAAILDGAVLGEGVGIEARRLDRQRMVDDQLGRHHRIDLGRIAALIGDGVAQARQIDQRRLAQNVVTDDARRVPGEVQVTLAVDDLTQRVRQQRRVAPANQLFGQDPQHIGQAVIGAGLDRVDRSARVEVIGAHVTGGAQQPTAVGLIHRCDLSSRKTEVGRCALNRRQTGA